MNLICSFGKKKHTSTGKLIDVVRQPSTIITNDSQLRQRSLPLGLIKENPYNRFQDQRGEWQTPHLTKRPDKTVDCHS